MVKKIKNVLVNSWYVHQYKHRKINKKRILVDSIYRKDLGSNLLRILMELQKDYYKDYAVWFSCDKKVHEKAEQLFRVYDLSRIRMVDCSEPRYLTLLSTAGFLFLDVTNPHRYIKKPGQVIINTWHGTPLKRMGTEIPGEAHLQGNMIRSLLMSDYLCLPNEYTRDMFRRAYTLGGIYKGTYVLAGYPRNQVFFDKERQAAVRKKLAKKNEKIYVYMPTWRGGGKSQSSGEAERQTVRIKELLADLDKRLEDGEILYLRLHPFVGKTISYDNFKHIVPMPGTLEPYEFLAAADCLITDYSSVFYDYANKQDGKIILFLYDREEYEGTRSIYGRMEDLPFPITEDVDALVQELRAPKQYEDAAFRETYCRFDSPDSASEIVRLALFHETAPEMVLEKEPVKKARITAFYLGDVLRIGITSAYLNLIDEMKELAAKTAHSGTISLDQEEEPEDSRYHFLAMASESGLRDDPGRLDVIPDHVDLMPVTNKWFASLPEYAALYLFARKNIDNGLIRRIIKKYYRREYQRLFGSAGLDVCVHYTGYNSKMIRLFQEAVGTNVIVIHNNMVQEIREKHNQHELTLKHAYREYDAAVAVSQSACESALAICGSDEKLHVIDNCMDYRGILEKAEQPLAFDPGTTSNFSVEELQKVLDSPARKFITVGRYSVEKNHKVLLDAFADYRKSHPDAFLILIGGRGDLYDETCRYAETLGLSKNVALIRYIANPMPVLKKCDLFLLPSLYEGQPMVLMEADVLGIPCAAADTPGCKEFMEDHGGYLFPCTKEGIVGAMEAFDRGEIGTMQIDYESRNRRAVEKLLQLIDPEG